MYEFIGAAAGTWILYNLLHIIFFNFLKGKTVKYIAFIGSFILILCVTTFTTGFVNGFITYIPLLFVWFLFDLIKSEKKAKGEDKHYETTIR